MSKISLPAPSNAVECQKCAGPMRHVDRQPYFCADCGEHLRNVRPNFGYHWEIHWGWLVIVETEDRYENEEPIGLEWTFHFEVEGNETEWVILANGQDFASAQAIAEGYLNGYLRRIYSGPTWDHFFKGVRLSSWEKGAPGDTCLWGDALDGRAYVWGLDMPEAN